VNEAWTLSPAAMVQLGVGASVYVIAVAVGMLPPNPDMKHDDEVRSTSEPPVGVPPSATDGVTVIVLLPDADKADVAVNRTVYDVDIDAVVLVGVTATLFTAPDGVPIV
jgi:hypothetical protein